HEELVLALKAAGARAAMNGITSVQTNDAKDNWREIYRIFIEANLPLRARLLPTLSRESLLSDLDDLRQVMAKSGPKVAMGTIKVMADGSLGARTAALDTPYADDWQNKGIHYYSQSELNELVACIHDCGLQVAIHAIGDYTVGQCLTAIELAQGGDISRRHRIIHCQVLRADLIDRMSRAGIIAEIQPVFLITDHHWTESRLGLERLSFAYCWKTLIERGVKCAGGSDSPVEDINPLLGIHAAVNRTDLQGAPAGGWLPTQRLSIPEAKLPCLRRGQLMQSIVNHLKAF
ncbi:MAG: amidohydrolase family protein, partial [bacterium]|nr:amidohydrolase family protein [bacterium]